MSTRNAFLERLCAALVVLVGFAVIVRAQGIPIPNVFTNRTQADAPAVNQNFTSLANNALNRNDGTMIGTLHSKGIQPVDDGAYNLGDASHRFMEGWFSGDIHAANCCGVISPGGDLPTASVIFFDGVACPAGWVELTAARGRYVVGLPAGGTLDGTSGTALTNVESRPVGQHNHTTSVTDPGHGHTYRSNIGGGGLVYLGDGGFTAENTAIGNGAETAIHSNTTGITVGVNNTGAVAGTNAPYIQLLVCKKS